MTITPEESQLLSGVRVAALVTNTCAPDPRVMKQAETIAKAGAEVTIFCMQGDEDVPNSQTLNGVKYHRLPSIIYSPELLLKAHMYFFLSSLKAYPVQTILLAMAFFGIVGIKKLRIVAQKVMKFIFFGRGVISPWPEFLRGKKSPFLSVMHAVYMFLRSEIYRQIFLESIVAYQPDIIHAHDFDTVPAALGYAKKTNAKVIFDAHEIEADRVGSNDNLSRWILKRELRRYLPKIDALIAVNQSSTKFYSEEYNLGHIPQAIIYNSPLTKSSDHAIDGAYHAFNLREKLKIPKEEILFVYTGNIGITRGVPEIVEAMKPVYGTHLCIMGTQRDNILKEFNAHVSKLNMDERVHILPPVPHEAVTETIKSADISIMFILPSCSNYTYCSPNKLFEAAMAGLPIVGPDLPEIERFIIGEGIGVIVKAGDIKDLTRAIAETAQDPLRFRPDAQKLQALREKWSWSAQEKTLVPFYKRVLARH